MTPRQERAFKRRRFLAPARQAFAPGYSYCLHCGTPWKWVEGKIIMYSESCGCFPICEECWDTLTPVDRLPYYLEHIRKYPPKVVDSKLLHFYEANLTTAILGEDT